MKLTALLFSVLVVGLCNSSCSPPTDAQAAVSETRVTRGTFVQLMLLTGELQSVEQVDLRVPKEAGWQNPITWMAEEGSSVKTGEIVLEFDNAALVTSLEEAKLSLQRAGNDLATKHAEFSAGLADKEIENATKRSAKDKAALAAEIPAELLPARDYQERQLTLKKAELDWAKALDELDAFQTASRADLDTARLAYEKADREVDAFGDSLNSLSVTAPQDGLLLHAEHPWEGRKMQVGDTIYSGAPVLHLPDLSSMKVKASLSDVDDGRILVGMPVNCTLDTHPGHVFKGRVTQVHPTAKPQSWRSLRRVFQVFIELDEADADRMIPGMSVRASVETHRAESVLMAQRDSLDLVSSPARALLATGETVEVELGACNSSVCIIESGMTEGTRLRSRGRS